MSLFWGRRRPTETRALSFQDVWGRGADQTLWNPAGLLSLIPLFAAHRLIIDSVAATPLYGYRRTADGVAQRVPSTPALLASGGPFGLQQFAWKAQCVASLVMDGNAFGLVTSLGRDGWPSALMWLDPARVDVQADDAHVRPQWLVDGREVDMGSFVHIPWIVPPGKVRGLSPLRAFMTAFETGQAAQTMARDWFKNGAMPSGHLKSENVLAPGQADETKRIWKAAVQGRDVFVSGADWSFQAIGVPADEARFIETLKLTATQIASIYGIPPEEIGGETGSSLTYATVEGNERRLAARVIRPWAVRIEEALSACMSRPVFAEFDLDAAARADLLTRMQAHEIAIRTGVETEDEARIAENRRPLTPEEKQAKAPPAAPAPEPPPAADQTPQDPAAQQPADTKGQQA